MSNDDFDHYNAWYKTLEFFILNNSIGSGADGIKINN